LIIIIALLSLLAIAEWITINLVFLYNLVSLLPEETSKIKVSPVSDIGT
jgi:hypothetical protein